MKTNFLKIFFLISILPLSICFAMDDIEKSMSINDFLLNNELLTVIRVNKIKPRFGCNPKNIKKNGTMGCYIDNPDK